MSQEDNKPEKPKIKEEMHTRCHFCGKDVAKVFLLITGPSVNICNECVVQCVETVMEEIDRREAKLNKVVSFKEKEAEE